MLIFGFYTSQYPSLMITNVGGIGDAYKTVSGKTLGLSRSLSLANKDWSCMTMTVSRPTAAGGGIVDQLNVPLFFNGYGPDTDGDGIKDNLDKCPAQAAAGTADGCPVAVAPPVAVPPVAVPPVAVPVTTTPTAPVKKSVPSACKKLKGKKRAICIKRQAALAKCETIKGASKKRACIKKAKNIKK